MRDCYLVPILFLVYPILFYSPSVRHTLLASFIWCRLILIEASLSLFHSIFSFCFLRIFFFYFQRDTKPPLISLRVCMCVCNYDGWINLNWIELPARVLNYRRCCCCRNWWPASIDRLIAMPLQSSALILHLVLRLPNCESLELRISRAANRAIVSTEQSITEQSIAGASKSDI